MSRTRPTSTPRKERRARRRGRRREERARRASVARPRGRSPLATRAPRGTRRSSAAGQRDGRPALDGSAPARGTGVRSPASAARAGCLRDAARAAPAAGDAQQRQSARRARSRRPRSGARAARRLIGAPAAGGGAVVGAARRGARWRRGGRRRPVDLALEAGDGPHQRLDELGAVVRRRGASSPRRGLLMKPSSTSTAGIAAPIRTRNGACLTPRSRRLERLVQLLLDHRAKRWLAARWWLCARSQSSSCRSELVRCPAGGALSPADVFSTAAESAARCVARLQREEVGLGAARAAPERRVQVEREEQVGLVLVGDAPRASSSARSTSSVRVSTTRTPELLLEPVPRARGRAGG